MKRVGIGIATIAALALLVAAAPASAKPKPQYFSGNMKSGEEIEFYLTGKRLTHFDGYVPVTCVPTHGTPYKEAGHN